MSENYCCLEPQVRTHGRYAITPIRSVDMLQIREWRNEQIDVLRQAKPLSVSDQNAYFESQIVPSFAEERPKQILFSFFKDENLIGYGGLVHIAWSDKRAEVSFLLESKRTYDAQSYHQDFWSYLQMIKEVAFRELGFRRIHTETFEGRPAHIATLESFGFQLEGRMRSHVEVGERVVDSLIHGLLDGEQ